MREVRQPTAQLPQEVSKFFQQFRRVRLKFRERFPVQICQQPDNSLRAVVNFCLYARFAAQRRNHPRQRQFTRRRYQMLQHRALHFHEAAFAVRVHDFQNEFAAVGLAQTKIVVVLARKRVRGGFYAKKPPRNLRCFRFRDRFRYRRFSHGALNFSGKRLARPIFRPLITAGISKSIDRYRPVNRRSAHQRRSAAEFHALLVVSIERAVAIRLNHNSRLVSVRHANRQRPILRMRLQA